MLIYVFKLLIFIVIMYSDSVALKELREWIGLEKTVVAVEGDLFIQTRPRGSFNLWVTRYYNISLVVVIQFCTMMFYLLQYVVRY